MNLASLIPAQYAKFITSLAGLLIVYLQMYGATWHLVPAVTAIGAALGVMGVPNGVKAPSALRLTSVRVRPAGQPAAEFPPELLEQGTAT